MILIDGKKAAAELREDLKQEILELKEKYNKVPGLTVILIGELAPSKIYVKNKEKSANEVGLKSEVIRYPNDVEEKTIFEHEELRDTVSQLSKKTIIMYSYHPKIMQLYKKFKTKILIDKYGKITQDKKKATEVLIANF